MSGTPVPTIAWHGCRKSPLAWSGNVVLRIEDIDSPRVKTGAAGQAMEDLRWLGLDWDYGPDVGGPAGSYVQTAAAEHITTPRSKPWAPGRANLSLHLHAIRRRGRGQRTARGPRRTDLSRHRAQHERPQTPSSSEADRPFCWRFRTTSMRREFHDRAAGVQSVLGACKHAREISLSPRATARRAISWQSWSTIISWE